MSIKNEKKLILTIFRQKKFCLERQSTILQQISAKRKETISQAQNYHKSPSIKV